jgi:hypothetical protein
MGALAPAEGFAYPPHTLAVAAAVLHSVGLDFRLADAVAASWSAADVLKRIPPGAVAVIQVSHATREADATFLAQLREERPDVRRLLIGPAAADQAWLDDGLPGLTASQSCGPCACPAQDRLAQGTGSEAVLAGEPELALPAAMQAVAGGARGVLTPTGLGVPGHDRHGRLVELDALPFPAWEHVPWQAYGFLSLFSSRGCPDGCRYCPYVLGWGDRFRARSVDRVLAEMRWLAERFAPPRLVFRDPVFARERDRVVALCRGIRQAGLTLAWECESRPEHFDRELLAEMRAAGCTTVKTGVESADPDLLVAVGRVANVNEAERYVQHAAEVAQAAVEVGLICRVFVMTGLPGETREAMRQTARFLQRLPRAVRVHVKPFIWYPGLALPPGLGVREDWLAALQAAADAREAGLWARLRRRVR